MMRRRVAAELFDLGDRDAALEVLARAITRHDPWVSGVAGTARYDTLRADPRGGALLATGFAR